MVFADQDAENLPALDRGGEIGGVAGLVQWRSLLQALMWPVAAIVPGVLGQNFLKMPLAEDLHVIKALAAECSHEPFRE
ncbi:MAG TPA: hypothetical protein VGS19_00330 [Streptosporangiaceae bacterium]|nr:hypothetical protein [Streptosporangiaceae bacterium]